MSFEFCAARNEFGYPCQRLVHQDKLTCSQHNIEDDIDQALSEWQLSIFKSFLR